MNIVQSTILHTVRFTTIINGKINSWKYIGRKKLNLLHSKMDGILVSV